MNLKGEYLLGIELRSPVYESCSLPMNQRWNLDSRASRSTFIHTEMDLISNPITLHWVDTIFINCTDYSQVGVWYFNYTVCWLPFENALCGLNGLCDHFLHSGLGLFLNAQTRIQRLGSFFSTRRPLKVFKALQGPCN